MTISASVLATVLLVVCGPLDPQQSKEGAGQKPATPTTSPPQIDANAWTTTGIAKLLAMQEGSNAAEWPYEGVYRESNEIPMGYRVGGTAICAQALLELPGFEKDEARKAAVKKAALFVAKMVMDDGAMGKTISRNYDVRGWGHAYALAFFMALERSKQVDGELKDVFEKAIASSLDVIAATEIPSFGGWNYSRPRGFKAPASPSSFMTAATLLALYDVAASGRKVDAAMITRALDFLESGRTEKGTYVYAGAATSKGAWGGEPEGNCARAAVVEIALDLAGRSSPDRVRTAIDQFVEHWEWLEKRRAQPGTHEPPFNIAPYYFYFGHEYAAMAVELLPDSERPGYRAAIAKLLARTRAEDGTWDDRVFPRSKNFGTAAALRTLLASQLRMPATYAAAKKDEKPTKQG